MCFHVCGREWRCSFITCVASTLIRPFVFVWITELMLSLCSHHIHHTCAYWLNQSIFVEPLLLWLCACTCVRTYVCALCAKCQNRYATFQVPCPSLLPTSQPLCGKMRPSSVCTMLLQHPHLPRTPPLLPHQSWLCPMQQSRHSPSTDLLRKRRRMTKITLFPRLLTCSGM